MKASSKAHLTLPSRRTCRHIGRDSNRQWYCQNTATGEIAGAPRPLSNREQKWRLYLQLFGVPFQAARTLETKKKSSSTPRVYYNRDQYVGLKRTLKQEVYFPVQGCSHKLLAVIAPLNLQARLCTNSQEEEFIGFGCSKDSRGRPLHPRK